MYENAFTNIEKALRAEAGIANELDYVEQISWVLFLKYLHDLEAERRDIAELRGNAHSPILPEELSWDSWAYPEVGSQLDKNALIGDDLIAFLDKTLFPELAKLNGDGTDPATIEYKIGEIFGELRNKFRSGYILRDVIEQINLLKFNTQEARHELSELYETRIRRMGNSGKNAGEYYTPRPLIRAMIQVLDPKIGETVYDGAVGSAGFLCEAYAHMRAKDLSASDYETLQKNTFYGQEKKALPYIMGVINMILHGVEAPNLLHTNTLNENAMGIQERDRHDIILANPPFGGGERKEVQQNFSIPSGETAYLFLQHFIRKLRAGGRAAVVIKNTFLSNDDNAATALRKELLNTCDLHTVLNCPQGTFQGAGVKTVVLFFEKGKATKDIWYYDLQPGRSLGKTNPLNDDDLAEFVSLQKSREESEKSWLLGRTAVSEETYDLTVSNPNAPEEEPLRAPEEIIEDMLARDAETAAILQKIRGLL